jgi:hypothetical protein
LGGFAHSGGRRRPGMYVIISFLDSSLHVFCIKESFPSLQGIASQALLFPSRS